MANVARFDGASTVTTSCGHNAWNQLVMFNGDPGNSRQYDLNGCLYHETNSDKYFNHDRWGRLKSVAAGAPNDVIARYAYDFAGRLILRTAADGSKERYYYDAGLSRVLVRVKPAGESAWKTKYVYTLNGGVAGQVLAERTVTAWSGTTPTAWTDVWLHYDLLGNVVGWHDPSGQFTRADRDAYGRPLPGTVAAQTPSGYGLTTKPRDPATGLIYFGARWYDPDNGRWLEPEPRGADGPNMYQFAANNPLCYFDLDGMSGRVPLPDGWSYDPGIKRPDCDNPNPNNPEDWKEQPHLNDPNKKKYHPGDKLPKNLPGKVRAWAKKKELDYKFAPDPWFEFALSDLNPSNNSLMWIPLGAGAAAAGLALLPAAGASSLAPAMGIGGACVVP